MNIPTIQTSYSTLNNLLYLSYLPKVINAALEVQLFEILSKKTASLDEIVLQAGTKKSVTESVLRVLVKIGLMIEENGSFKLTDLSRDYLVQASDANQLTAVQKVNGSSGPYDNLSAALKGEAPEFDGKMWTSKQASVNMEQGMKAGGLQSVVSFVKTIPEFDSCTKMCDFAGNVGYFSYAFLQNNPHLESHVYDLPEVCANARELKQNEKDFNRVTYHDFDMKKGDSFGDGYDLFFTSHFLYELGAKGELTRFFKKVNKAMKPGGILISNHMCHKATDKETQITLALVELQTRAMGYPTHQLPESTLKQALTDAGFKEFTVKQPDGRYAFPTLLLAARKQ